jgi:hypothetical protein
MACDSDAEHRLLAEIVEEKAPYSKR